MENKVSEQCAASFCVDAIALNKLLQDPRFKQVKIDASEKELVLFLGLTGSGKSTCINYLLGAKLLKGKKSGGKSYVSLELSQTAEYTKYAEIGDHGHQSHTLHAEIYQDPIVNLGYVDTPAFFNPSNLHDAEEVYGSFGTQLAVHSAKSIKAVVVVIDWNIFNSTTATELKNLLYTLSKIFPVSEAISGSLIFLINKASNDITLHDFHETVLMFRESQNEKKLLLEKKNPNVDDDEQLRIKNEIRMIDLLEKQCRECQQNIIILDVLDNGESRNRFHKTLRQAQKPIPKDAFDFRKYNKNREIFEAEFQKQQHSANHTQEVEARGIQITKEDSYSSFQQGGMDIVFELMSQSDIVNKGVTSNATDEKEELAEVRIRRDQKVIPVLKNLDSLYLLSLLIKALCIGLGIAGLVLSIIGVSAIINPSLAMLLVENIFHEASSYAASCTVIYGLIAIVSSFVIYKIPSLVSDLSNNNEPVTCEDNLQYELAAVSTLAKNPAINKPLKKPLFSSEIAKSHICSHPGNDIGAKPSDP